MPKLMVVIDPQEETHSGLERCKEIAPNAGLDIHVVSFVQASGAKDMAGAIRDAQAKLTEVVKPFTDVGYQTTEEVVPFTRLYESVVQTAVKCGADLLVKPMRQHSLARRIIMTSTDWNLVRFCPTPLYLVNGAVEVHGKPILAAIDIENPDDQHAQLNEVVMTQANAIAGVFEGTVNCVNSWHVNPAVMSSGSVDPTPYEISRDMHADHLEKSRTFASAHSVEEGNVHVHEGTPQFVIQEVAEELDAGVLVIGTVARTGVSGLFIGNTAETVLEGTMTDVMVVKSPDFKSPI